MTTSPFLRVTASNVRCSCRKLLYLSLTTENKVVAENTYADQFSSYNDVKQVLLDSTGADAEAAADRMFSHDMDGICNTTPVNYMRRINQWATRICQDARTRGEFQDTLVLARTTAALTKEGKQFVRAINPTTASGMMKALAKWVTENKSLSSIFRAGKRE